MSGQCTVKFDEKNEKDYYTEEERKFNNKQNKASRVEPKKHKSPFALYEYMGWWGKAKNMARELVQYANGYAPKYLDLAKDLWSEEKMRDTWDNIHKRVDWNVQNIIRDGFRFGLYQRSLRHSMILSQIQMRGNLDLANKVGLTSDFDIMGYKQWMSDKSTNNSLMDYKKFIEDFKAKDDALIADDTLTLEAIKQRNAMLQETLDKINLIDPSFTKKLLGNLDSNDPIAIGAAVMGRAMTAKGGELVDKIYNQLYGFNVKGTIDFPEWMEHNMHQLLNAHYNSLRFHNELMKENKNYELIQALLKYTSSAKPLTLQDMRALPDGHPARDLIDDLDARMKSDPALMQLIKHTNLVGDINILVDALQKRAMVEVRKSFSTMSDKARRLIENNANSYPTLYKALKNGDFGNHKLIIDEMKAFNDTYGDNLEVHGTNFHEAELWYIFSDELKNASANVTTEVSKEALKQIQTQFPGYVLVTRNGSQVYSKSGKFEDIEHNGDMIGHIADLTNPEMLLEDVIAFNKLKDVGDKALIDMIKRGDIALIPKDKAKMLAEAKKAALPSDQRRSIIAKINSVFSKHQLFGPTRILPYFQQQVLGNIGSTIAAHPGAFKYWPAATKAVLEYWRNGKNPWAIKDPQMKKIISYLLSSEGGGMHSLTMEDMKLFGNEEFQAQLEALSNENKPESFLKFWNKYLKGAANISSAIESISRGALAYHILEARKKGKGYTPLTANAKRVEDLWGIDNELAAVRLSNDAHIDYRNLPPKAKELFKNFPFISFVMGSALNNFRQMLGLVNAYKAAFRGEEAWSTVGRKTALSVGSLVFRYGALAFMVNSVWKLLGMLPEDQEEKMKKSSDKNLIQSILGITGADTHLWSSMYIPGSSSKMFNDIVGIGKTTNAYDQFKQSEQMIPYLTERWYAKDDDGKMKSPIQIGAEQYISMMSPAIKIPVELAMGGGTLMSDGYVAPRSGQGAGQTVTEKVASMFGLNTFTRDAFNAWYGNDDISKSPSAVYHQVFMSQMNEIKYADTPSSDLNKQLGYAIKDLNVNHTHDIIAKLEQEYSKEGLTQSEISSKLRSTFDRNTISGTVGGSQYQGWLSGMNSDDRNKMQKALDVEKDFRNAIGYNYW